MEQLAIISYNASKANGSIVSIMLLPDGDTIEVQSKRFDPATGAALPNLVTRWSKADINNQIANIELTKANFTQVLADIA